jgi:hypothetical protein
MKQKVAWAQVFKAATGLETTESLFHELYVRPSDKHEFERAVRKIGKFCEAYAKFKYLYDKIYFWKYKNIAKPPSYIMRRFNKMIHLKIDIKDTLFDAYDANYIPMFEFHKNNVLSNTGIGLLHKNFVKHLEDMIFNANLFSSHIIHLYGRERYDAHSMLERKRKELDETLLKSSFQKSCYSYTFE